MLKNTVEYPTGSKSIEDFSQKKLLRQKGNYQLWISGHCGIVTKIGVMPTFDKDYTIEMAIYDWNAVTGDKLTSLGVESLYEQKNNMA